MDIEEVRQACLSMHEAVEECTPFASLGHPDIAFKIAGKIFAFLCVPTSPSSLHADALDLLVLKQSAQQAVELCEAYPDEIEPAWHWNKKFWIQLHYSRLPDGTVERLIRQSYGEVVAKLPKALRNKY